MFFQHQIDLPTLNRKLTAEIDRHCGLEVTAFCDSERTFTAKLKVSERVVQPFGLLHGGVSCLLAESLCSLAGNLALEEGLAAVGQSLQANHMRSARLGETVTFECKNLHKGRMSQVWDVQVTDENQRLLSKISFTLAHIVK